VSAGFADFAVASHVCLLLISLLLVLACHMEAVQLSGYWKAGGSSSVQPEERLAAHNHSWMAVKVRGTCTWGPAIKRAACTVTLCLHLGMLGRRVQLPVFPMQFVLLLSAMPSAAECTVFCC
jgi:hypothetical protein